jgi:predicted acyltransferase
VLANQSLNKDGLRTTLFWNTVKRCIRLFILGLLVQGTNQFGTAYDFSSLRICGILQRIAFCQLVVAVIELTVPVRDIGYQDTGYFRLYGKFAWHWFVTFLILMVYTIIMYTTPVPGCPHAGLSTPQCNAAGYWDTQILGLSHMYTHPTYHRLPECSSCSPRYCPIPNRPEWCELPFDPEGAIASICAIGSVFIGAFVGHIFIDTKQSQAERMRQMGPLAIVLTLIGVVMHFAGIPFNKNLYSLSYMFFMGGTSIGCLMLFCLLIDIMKLEKPFWPFIWMGLNAIAIFVGNDIGDAVLGWFYYQKPENNIASLVRDKLFVEYMGYDGGLMAFTWLKMIFWVAVSGLLVRLKIFIKI